MVEARRRWKEIDVLYTIGIILVLIGHSHSSDWSTFQGTVLHKAILFIYTFHMPLFFFISGFLFQNSGRLEKDGYGIWIKDKALRLLTPYLFWSLFAVIPKYFVENRTFAGVSNAVLDVFINPRTSVWGHFWFLPILFLTYVLFGIASSAARGKGVTGWLLLATAIIYFIPLKTELFGVSDLHTALLFFALGMGTNQFISKKPIDIPRWGGILWVVVVIPGCILVFPYANNNPIAALAVAILMISVCWVLATMIQIKGWISSHNFTIYIFSWFFQAVMMALCDRASPNWIVTFFLMFTIGLAGPITVIIVYDHMSFLHHRCFSLIFGMRES